MAATNYTPIQLYYSTTASAAPTAGNLVNGELAINITDGKLYYKDNGGVVQVIATKGAGTIGGSNTQIQFNDGGALAGNAAMVFNKATNVTTLTTLNLTNALGATYGGTAQSAYAQGDLLYASAVNTLSKLSIGTVNYILTSTGSVPQWVAPTSVTVQTANNLAGGAAGSVPYQSAADTTTFLSIGAANRVMTSTGSAPQWVTSLTGLTGVSSSSMTNTSLTSGRVVYSGASGVQTDSANLTFNGTTLSAGGFSTTGNSTLVKLVTIGDSGFTTGAVLAAATPAKLYIGTGAVTDGTSAGGATNTLGTITAFGQTQVIATNANVTYTNLATLYIAGAPTAGTNVTITNPYALYVAAGDAYFGGTVTAGTVNLTTLDLTNLEVTNIKAKDGTASITLADSTGVASFSANPVLSGGTANGVTYLNGSKVLTSGSALTFDGTIFAVNGLYGSMVLNGSTSGYSGNITFKRSGTTYGYIGLNDNSGNLSINSGQTGQSGYFITFGAGDGTEQMRLTSTGLGIGTSAPAYKLDVDKGSAGLVARFKGGTRSAYIYSDNDAVYFTSDTSVATAFGVNETSDFLTFYTGNAERGRFSSTGNFSVGATNQQGRIGSYYAGKGSFAGLDTSAFAAGVGGTLDLGGNYRSTGDYQTFVRIAAEKNNATDGDYGYNMGFYVTTYPNSTFGTKAMTIDSLGNLFVGWTPTGSGTAKFAVKPSSTYAMWTSVGFADGTAYGLEFGLQPGHGSYRSAVRGLPENYGGTDSGALAFYTSNSYNTGAISERVRITSAGNVGIGTNSPSQKLVVYDSGTVYSIAETGNAGSYAIFEAKNPSNSLLMWNRGDNSTSVIKSTAWDFQIGTDAAKYLSFITNSSERIRITSAGLVGIGTSSPQTALQVNAGAPTIRLEETTTGGSKRLELGVTSAGVAFIGANQSAQDLTFQTVGLTVGRFDSSGRLLVGLNSTQSNNAQLQVKRTNATNGALTYPLAWVQNATGFEDGFVVRATDNLVSIGADYGGTNHGVALAFLVNNSAGAFAATEAGRFTADGNFLVGTTTASGLLTVARGASGVGIGVSHSGDGGISAAIRVSYTAATGTAYQFDSYFNGSRVGYISSTSTATAYNTSSDYRLKDNPQPLTGSGEFIDALQPKTWSWKADGSKGVGFIAHEVQEVSPSTVTGVKDAEDADGKPEYQGMEYGSAEFIANIIAELQSLRKRVAQLEQGV